MSVKSLNGLTVAFAVRVTDKVRASTNNIFIIDFILFILILGYKVDTYF